MARASRSAPAPAPAPPAPGPAVWVAAAVLGGATGAWALWLWRQLLVLRAGGSPSCGLGGDGSACAAAWDSAFAGAVHAWTGIPVAGWGLVWGVLATAFPLAALLRRRGTAGAATLAVALGGVLGVLALAAGLLAAGSVCQGCLVTYGLVLAYAALVFFGAPRAPRAALRRGAGTAVVAGIAVWLLLLVPGLRTPKSTATLASLEGVSPPGSGVLRADDPSRALARMVEVLPEPAAQELSDELWAWSRAKARDEREPRALYGSPMAPVRITDFADVLCGHCANLHLTLEELLSLAPAESFAIESRFFPLDGTCNPHISHKGDGVRCQAARALICIQGQPGAFEAAGRLYRGQRSLDREKILELLSPVLPRERLEACMESPETEAKLASDIEWAVEEGITGTPLVLANGRRASAFPPFLFALVLSGGDPKHPALAALPPPRTGGS